MSANPSLPPQFSQPEPPSPQPVPLSEGERLLDTFIAPTKTFTDLKRNASWWAPYLIIAITSVLFVYVVNQKVGFAKVVDNIIQLQPKQAEKIDRLPPDQKLQIMDRQVTFTKFLSYAIPIVALIYYAVLGGVLFATLKFAVGSDIKFKNLYALIVYTRLPQIFLALLGILSLVAGSSGDGFNLENPIATNAGYFIGPEGSPVLRTLLTPFDVLSLWSLILTAIGISCISNVKRGTAFAVVFGWFALVVIVRVAFAAATS
jgi:Yip1 domain